MPDIRQLQQFIAVAEELSFRRAAERLHMSQPPLSQAIQRLEEELGARLFDRNRRKVELTQPGRIFLDRARIVVSQMDQAAAAARGAAQGMIGRLSVGFVPTAVYEILPAILRVLRDRQPLIDLDLHELNTADQAEPLLQRRLDVSLNRPPTFYSKSILQEIVVRERTVVALPAEHPLAEQEAVALAQLREEPFVLIQPRWGTGYHTRVLNACQGAGFTPRVVQEGMQMHSVVGFVAAGIGVALCPASLLNLQPKGAVYRELEDPSRLLYMDLGMAWHEANRSPTLYAFLAAAREVAARYAA